MTGQTTTATTALYTGASMMVYGGYTASDVVMLTGGIVGIIGLIVTWVYYQKRLNEQRKYNDHILKIERKKLKILQQE